MKIAVTIMLCAFIISCTDKSKQEATPRVSVNNVVGISDILKVVVVDTTIILFPDLLTEEKKANEIYLAITEKPEFPGGMHELITFIQKSIQYPSSAYKIGKQGRVIVQAIIDTDGSVIQPSVIYSVDSLLDKEALRIIQSMPKWKPGKHCGKSVRVRYHFPVTFRITDNNTEISNPFSPMKE